jgi:ABC-2 type transport system permease protein
MKFPRIKAIAKKELLQIRRDPFSLAMAFLMPVLLLLIFGYAITLDVNKVTAVVYDLDRSSVSRELLSGLTASGYFTIVRYADHHREIDDYLDSGKARVAFSIPPDFSETVRSGGTARLQVIVDGSDSNTATIALGYVATLMETYGRRLGGGGITPLIDTRGRVWYNPELKSRNFIVPGLIAVIMAVIVALLTSLTVAREWERGTMEQLIATPVKTRELIIGKIIPYLFIGLIDTGVAALMGTALFDVPLRGSVLLLMTLASVFLFGGLSWGIFISIVARTQVLASQMAIVSTFLPAFLLSGFLFSIWNMPKPLQLVTYIIPARYFVSILKGIFLKGSALPLLAVEALLLAVYGAVVFTAAGRKFRKRVPS